MNDARWSPGSALLQRDRTRQAVHISRSVEAPARYESPPYSEIVDWLFRRHKCFEPLHPSRRCTACFKADAQRADESSASGTANRLQIHVISSMRDTGLPKDIICPSRSST